MSQQDFETFTPITSDFGSLIADHEERHDLFLEQQRVNMILAREQRDFRREFNAERNANRF